MKKIILIIALAGIAVAPALGQTAGQDTATRNFIIKAGIGNLQEVAAGKLAAQKATDPAIKAFGTKMVSDHTQAQARLMKLANAKGYQIPPQATNMPVPDAMLAKAPAMDFDRLYVHMMVPDHRSTVLMFQMYAISGKDPDVKAFAVQTLPTLKEHLAVITELDEKVKYQSAK